MKRSNDRKMIIAPYNIDWKNSALHNDDKIMKELLAGILRLALSDWKAMEDKDEVRIGAFNITVFRDELIAFFNSSWFGDILAELFPQFDQESACMEIAKRRYDMRDIFDPTRNQKRGKKKKS